MITKKKYIPKYNKRKKRERKNYTIRKKKGGKAIDAGSYGCVFDPAIKCLNSDIPYKKNYISKLMYKKDTKSEIEEMNKVKKKVETIPNKDDYFIMSNTHVCEPAKLQEEDLRYFDKKCKLFTKRGINKSNVNNSENLKKLSIIVMPNGGLNIDKYIYSILQLSYVDMYAKFKSLNNALIKLLINGIVPINLMRFNHYDIKAQNIVFSENDGFARLIDWGLSGECDGITIPEELKDRSIAFNMPYSDIFFNLFVKNWLPTMLNKIKSSNKFSNSKTGQNELLKVVAVNMINKSIEETSEGHYGYIIENILHNIYKIYSTQNIDPTILDYNVLSYNTIIDYVHAVLINYVDEQGNFNDITYFYEVFQKNVDIWGFLMAYLPIIEFYNINDNEINKFNIDIINAICRIFLKYCFSVEFAIKPINLNELVIELQSINNIIDDAIIKSTKNTQLVSTKKPSNNLFKTLISKENNINKSYKPYSKSRSYINNELTTMNV